MTNRELHYKYIISYLLVAIIIILALAYYNVPDLVDKLSFALTLSSLLLAILAIFYTIISANKQDDQFTKLIETHSELKASAGEIKNVSRNINSILSDVPRHFESLGEKLDFLKEKYNSPPSKLIQSEEGGNISSDIGLNIDRQILAKMGNGSSLSIYTSRV